MTEVGSLRGDEGERGLAGRVCVVTGATSGIGQETALGLARLGARVALVGRSPERTSATRRLVQEAVPGARIDCFQADLASQAQIRRVAAELQGGLPAIHVLVNNAGIVNLRRETTEDGLEATFAVNHLAYFLLTHLLLETLRASAPARVVNVASDAHRFGRLDESDLQSERRYRAMQVYGRSKTANILFTRELARRLDGSGVTVHCLHPGAVSTRLGQQNGAWSRVVTRLLAPFFLSPAQGAATSLYLASSPEVAGTTGGYFSRCAPHTPAAHARDDALARRLFEESARLCGVSPAAPLAAAGGG